MPIVAYRVHSSNNKGKVILPSQSIAAEHASKRADLGVHIATRLKRIAQKNGSKVGLAVAERLSLCTYSKNVWHSKDQHNRTTGELYEGYGNLWACGHQLCPMCNVLASRALRKRARAAVDCCGHGNFHQRWRSIVLTMPLMKDADIKSAIKQINSAFTRLINYAFWRSRVIGGFKSVESTVRPNGFHVHIHGLILSEYMPVNFDDEEKMLAYIRERKLHQGNLTDAMMMALKATGARVAGKVNVAIFDVLRRAQRNMSSQKITLDEALSKSCKYLTKTESWANISDTQLLCIAEVERWPRMFEVLGRARQSRGATGHKGNSHASAHGRTRTRALVHNTVLSNFNDYEKKQCERPPTWREMLGVLSLEEWREWQHYYVQKRRKYQRVRLSRAYPHATFTDLDGEAIIEGPMPISQDTKC